jgi:predicted DNA-binding antitoxin AbrB/MazE fold protein
VRPIKARYENGLLRLVKPLPVRPGENVAVIIVRQPDRARWDLNRLRAAASEDEVLAGAGLSVEPDE